MNKQYILSSILIGFIAFLVTSGVNRLFEGSRLHGSKWMKRGLIVVLVFVAVLGVKVLIG